MENKQKTLIFQHIPKTAGSTVHNLLNKHYKGQPVYRVFGSYHDHESIQALKNSPETDRRKIALIKGHMPFGLHRYIPGECHYFTVLRDPVKRVISQYFYIKNNPRNPLHAPLVGNGWSVADFMREGKSEGMNNGHIRWILGDLQAVPFGEIGPSHLEQAIENLEKHFLSVGINEMFDQSILVLARKLGWKGLPYYTRKNTNRRKTAIPDADIDVIREYNRYDIELYRYGVERLQKEIADIDNFDALLHKYRRNNRYLSLLKSPLSLLRGG